MAYLLAVSCWVMRRFIFTCAIFRPPTAARKKLIRSPNLNFWLTESLCTNLEQSARGGKDHRPKHESTPAKEEQPAHKGDEDTH